MDEDRSLELPPEKLRELIGAAARRIVDHVASLPEQPSADTEGGAALARSLAAPMPETGRPAEELLDLLFRKVVPKSFNTAGPGYLAYIPGGGLPQSAVADLIADAVNRYVGVFAAAPGLAQLETNVVRWFSDLAGYPPEARGILTSGGSLATFSALVAARRDRLPEDFMSGTLYVSTRRITPSRKPLCSPAFRRTASARFPSTTSTGSASTPSRGPSPTTAPRA